MKRNKKLTLGVLKRVSSLQALPVACVYRDLSRAFWCKTVDTVAVAALCEVQPAPRIQLAITRFMRFHLSSKKSRVLNPTPPHLHLRPSPTRGHRRQLRAGGVVRNPECETRSLINCFNLFFSLHAILSFTYSALLCTGFRFSFVSRTPVTSEHPVVQQEVTTMGPAFLPKARARSNQFEHGHILRGLAMTHARPGRPPSCPEGCEPRAVSRPRAPAAPCRGFLRLHTCPVRRLPLLPAGCVALTALSRVRAGFARARSRRCCFSVGRRPRSSRLSSRLLPGPRSARRKARRGFSGSTVGLRRGLRRALTPCTRR